MPRSSPSLRISVKFVPDAMYNRNLCVVFKNCKFSLYMCVFLHILFLKVLLRSTSLVAQKVKNPPSMQETRDRSPGREDPLEKEMETLSSILAWKIPWTEEPGGLQSMGSQRVGQDWETSLSLCSILAWRLSWTFRIVHGAAESNMTEWVTHTNIQGPWTLPLYLFILHILFFKPYF